MEKSYDSDMLTVTVCSDKECEKFIKGFCKVQKSYEQKDNIEIREMFKCTCRNCIWDYSLIEQKLLEPCKWVGDAYNTDHDCIAEK
jgi:hypothetical protein